MLGLRNGILYVRIRTLHKQVECCFLLCLQCLNEHVEIFRLKTCLIDGGDDAAGIYTPPDIFIINNIIDQNTTKYNTEVFKKKKKNPTLSH